MLNQIKVSQPRKENATTNNKQSSVGLAEIESWKAKIRSLTLTGAIRELISNYTEKYFGTSSMSGNKGRMKCETTPSAVLIALCIGSLEPRTVTCKHEVGRNLLRSGLYFTLFLVHCSCASINNI